jgi:signal transduction histidine kinase
MILIPSYGYRAVKQIESTNTILRQEFLRRDDLLDRLRSDLYHSAIQVRDYLLHFDPQQADRRRSELHSMRRRMIAALQQYQAGLSPEESVTVRELQRDLTEYWDRLEPAFGWASQGDYGRAYAFLREEIFPRHKQLLQLADRIAAIDERQIRTGENSVAAVFIAFRRQIAAGALLIIALGSGVAVFSIRRILHLERISDLRYREGVQARKELQRLSARLVAAQEDERRRLSRELHDQVGQYMSAVLVELGNVDAGLPGACPGVRERLMNVRQLAETSVAAVRNMMLLLRPSMLDDLGLVAALRWQGREMSRRTSVKVKVAADAVLDDLPDEYRTCIYRVVQEALHNSARHAKPSLVRVTARQRPGEISVAIQDDGVGFDARKDKGMGVLGMEERVLSLGGFFRVDSEPGNGTIVSILLPLAQAASTKEN